MLSRTWSTTQNDLSKVKPIMLKMKTQMTGVGSGNVLNLLSQIKTPGELATLVKNWKNISGDNKTLFQWLSEEYTISWDQVLSVLEKNFKKYIVRKVPNISTTV